MTAPVHASPSLVARLDAAAGTARAWLDRRSRAVFVTFAVALSLAVSLTVLSPRIFLLFGAPLPGTFEWDRGLSFLAQVRDPFNATVEPALRWRLAPALLGHLLHLPGYAAFAVPWAGLLAVLAYTTALAEARLRDRLDALLLVVLVGTLAAVQSITMAHGINDGWLLLALLATAFSSHPALRAGAAFIGPWIDERYLFALPLCLVCRAVFAPPEAKTAPAWRFAALGIAGAACYLGVRLAITARHGDPISDTFVRQALAIAPTYLPHAPLGWWMGQRAAWVLVVFAVMATWRQHGSAAVVALALATLSGFGAVTLLAADLTRTTNFFFPLTCAGAFAASHVVGAQRTRWFATLLGLNLVLPFAMMTYVWIVPIHSLPFELLRLAKHG